MALGKGVAAARKPGEETPLLGESTRRDDRDDGSSETLTDGSTTLDTDEELEDLDKPNQQVGRWRGILIILSVGGLIFLQASNMSALTTIQSKIAEDLDAFASATWFTSAYLIALSSLAPVSARLAQIFSPRNCIFVSSLLFGLGGLVTSQAPDLRVFLLGRVISGIGGSGCMTVSLILVLELSGKKRRGLFVGLVNFGFTAGVSLGAILAGALAPVLGWRFIFWIQTPLAVVGGIGIFLSIPKTITSGYRGASDGSIASKLAKIDYLGAVTLTSCIVLFLFGLASPQILLMPIIASAFVLIIFIITEVYIATDPIIPVTVLKSPGALLSCLGQLGLMSARWMVLFYSPVYALAVRGWSPASAGSILIPTNLGFGLGGLLVGWLHIKRTGSFWSASIICFFLFSCSLAVLSQIATPATPAPLFFLCVFINGLCTGAALNYTLAHVLHLTPPSTHFISTSLLATFRGFAGSFGSAIGGGLFVRTLKSGLEKGFEAHGGLEGREDLVRKLLGSPALVQTLKGTEKEIAVASYIGGLKGLFFAAAVLAMIMVFVQAGTGWRAGVEKEENHIEQVGQGAETDEDEWEEGLEQGV